MKRLEIKTMRNLIRKILIQLCELGDFPSLKGKCVVILFCLGLTSYAAKPKFNITSEESLKIRGDVSQLNVSSLISDYEKYPDYKEEISTALFGLIDWDQFTYSQLVQFKNESHEPTIKQCISEIMHERETNLLEELSQLSLVDVADFYRTHRMQMPFLSEFVDSTIIANIPKMKYSELKYASYVFDGTPPGAILESARDAYKKAHKKEIMNSVDFYIEKEKLLISYLEYALEMYVYSKAYGSLSNIMEDVFKGDMPGNYSDCDRKVANAINRNFNAQDICDFANEQVSLLIENINASRKSIISSVSLKFKNNQKMSCMIENKLKIGILAFKYNMTPIYRISDIDNETSALGTALSIASFFSGGLLSLASAAYDIYEADDKGTRQRPHIQNFINNYESNMKSQCQTYVSKIVKDAKKKVENSQSKFKEEYYEAY